MHRLTTENARTQRLDAAKQMRMLHFQQHFKPETANKNEYRYAESNRQSLQQLALSIRVLVAATCAFSAVCLLLLPFGAFMQHPIAQCTENEAVHTVPCMPGGCWALSKLKASASQWLTPCLALCQHLVNAPHAAGSKSNSAGHQTSTIHSRLIFTT